MRPCRILTTLCLVILFFLAQGYQVKAAAPVKEITKLEIDESAKSLLRLPWEERQKRFQDLEKGSASSNVLPPQDAGTRLQLLALLEAERRFMHSGADVDSKAGTDVNAEAYPAYLANLIVVITKLKAPETYDALIDPVFLNWGYNAEALGATGAASVEPIIAEFRRAPDDIRKGNLFLALQAMLGTTPSLPEEKRAEIGRLALEQTQSSNPSTREIALKCLAYFTDAEAMARVKYIRDADGVYLVRIFAGIAAKKQMETLAKAHQ